MKIIADNQEEFEELCKTFLYLHDFHYLKSRKLNWKVWQWFFFDYEGEFTFYPWIEEYECLDLEEYPLLNSMVHLYRVKHAHEETNGMEESKALKKMFYVKK